MNLQDELQVIFDDMAIAYRSGDAAGCAAAFTEDALLTSPYAPPAQGRSAIEALHVEWTSEGSGKKTLEVVDCGRSGDLAWCLVHYDEGEHTGRGTSLNIVEREAGGPWRIRMSSLNEIEPGQV